MIFITGEFNDKPDSIARKTFVNPLDNGLSLLDALSNLKLNNQMTYNNFTEKFWFKASPWIGDNK
ncbi:MAG: hypothetical protein F6K40_12930 [Okeania sp. SIO3I5]|uniref:hypothetical protein n=1 Tax=Okeania sp. SIO3I5 TaxID=2607805 RepID=UPI0013BE2D34|nr:hypothetical protein [Okeania sp. SIO3I5]NEQ37118.1 hypothetical protein [Okeania sp. SIO3I5]